MTDHHHKIIKGLMISLLLIIADINFPFLSPVPSQTNKPQASSSNVNEEADYQSSMMSEAYDLKSIGCNTKAISHTLNNPTPNGFVNFNGVNLPNILHTSTFVFDASQGNTICITYQNGTENAGSKEYNYLMNTVDVIKVGPSLVKYVTTASYTAAVNININTQCSCNCDYFEMYDYLNCEVDECVKVASQTRNGCGFAKVGWPSCLINFDTYETAKFYTISPPVYAYVPFDEYILYEAPMNLSYINPNTNCNLKYTSGSMNFTKGNSPNMYNTFPINAQYSYTKVTPNQFPISNPPMTGSFVSNAPLYPDLTNPCLQEALARIPYSKNVNVKPLGQFNLITYPGNEILAFYKNEWYKPADVNGVNEFNPRLCGWLKLNGKTNLFDKVQASKSATLKTYDCGEKTMELNYDITSCNTSNWIKLDSYMAEWGIMSTENALNGEFSLKTRNQAGTLLEVTTDFPASIINYVYGIFSFSCSSIRGFQSSTILCNMTYQVGDQKTHFVIRDKNEVVVYENDVILDGTGKEEVTIIIPHQIYKTFSYICFPDVKTKTKCANITLDAYGFNTTNPNWISFINSSDADDTSNSINVELPSFNFFDPSTWEHNLTKTIFTWIGIFLICCLLIIIIATIIYCSPQIYIMYEQTKLRLNRYRKKEVNFSPLISEESEL